MTAEIILYDYWRSSSCHRLRIALNLAGLPYRAAPVDLLAGEQRAPAHRARNPQGLVPVLEIDGHRLTQSLAILTYLDATRRLGLLPRDPARRAAVEALAHSLAVDLHPVCNLAVASHAVALQGGREEARGEWMRRFIRPALKTFEALLGRFEQAPYCVGATPSLADVCLIPQLHNADRWGARYADLPRIRRAAAACADHPAFAAARPEAVRPS